MQQTGCYPNKTSLIELLKKTRTFDNIAAHSNAAIVNLLFQMESPL